MRFHTIRLLPLLLAVGCTAGPSSSSSGTPTPGFPGAGDGFEPLPETPENRVSMICFYGDDDKDNPAATIEYVLETVEGVDSVHARLTIDPKFVDNTYGVNSIGWEESKKGEHTYKQLDGSDHAQLLFYNGDGELSMDFAIDYITEGVSNGVTDKDGEMFTGREEWVLATSTSLAKNFEQYAFSDYNENSPATDENYTPHPDAPNWDYRVVYEAWISLEAFGPSGFDTADVEYIHASPAKGDDNTIIVDPDPCPPEWDPEGPCNDPDGCEPGDGGDGDGDGDCDDPDGCPGGDGDGDGECNDPDGCEPGDGGDGDGDGECNDPDGCEPGEGPECTTDAECPDGEICSNEGVCEVIVQ